MLVLQAAIFAYRKLVPLILLCLRSHLPVLVVIVSTTSHISTQLVEVLHRGIVLDHLGPAVLHLHWHCWLPLARNKRGVDVVPVRATQLHEQWYDDARVAMEDIVPDV